MLFNLDNIYTEEELDYLLSTIQDEDNKKRFQKTINKIKERNKNFIKCRFCGKQGGTLRKWEKDGETFYFHKECLKQ